MQVVFLQRLKPVASAAFYSCTNKLLVSVTSLIRLKRNTHQRTGAAYEFAVDDPGVPQQHVQTAIGPEANVDWLSLIHI